MSTSFKSCCLRSRLLFTLTIDADWDPFHCSIERAWHTLNNRDLGRTNEATLQWQRLERWWRARARWSHEVYPLHKVISEIGRKASYPTYCIKTNTERWAKWRKRGICPTQKNKTNTSGKELKETDISNICYNIKDKEFKVMVIKMLSELRRRMNEYSENFNKQRK